MGAVVGWIRLGTGAAAHRFEGGTLRLTPLGASPASPVAVHYCTLKERNRLPFCARSVYALLTV